MTPGSRPIAVVMGTRPEAIKLAPVVIALRRSRLHVRVITTGQHRELVHDALALFGIAVDDDLALMRPGQTLDYVLSASITGIGELLEDAQPVAVLVQGDTTSSLGAAIAAFHHGVPVGHVEAGLRSHNLALPYPEEMNRRAISVVARWHFAPTAGAARNLEQEGVTAGVHVTGNTIVDAVHHVLQERRELPESLGAFIGEAPLILATAHRRESWAGGIEEIALALRDVLDACPDHRLVFATHPNPLARGPVDTVLGGHPAAMVVDALDYGVFLNLLSRAGLVISDSGGVQEEGPTLGVPVLVTRAVTERPEGVDAGAVRIVGTDAGTIRTEALRLLGDDDARAAMAAAGRGVYGDGTAAARIVALLARDLELVASHTA